MKKAYFLFISLLFAIMGITKAEENPLDKVSLFLGTANDYGQLSPGACVPFGMIQVCPDSNPRQHPGYDHEIDHISGFSINRLSGVGGSGCGGNVSLMPDKSGEQVLLKRETEKAFPGFYEVELSNGVKMRSTATNHMAVEQYIYPNPNEAFLILNPASAFDRVSSFGFTQIDARTATGHFRGSNTCGRGQYYLYYQLYSNCDFRIESSNSAQPRLKFSNPKDNMVEIRIVVSNGLETIPSSQNQQNVWSESFENIQQKAAEEWKKVLSVVDVKGGTEEQQRLFYTSVYRTCHSPFQVTEKPLELFLGTDGKPHEVPFHYYSSWSLWDTYRTKFPLLCLLQPNRSSDIMQSLAYLYITGKKDWSTDYECVPTVRSEHAIATLLEAYRQGVRIDNLEEALPGMEEEVKRQPTKSPDQCLETAGDFWALSELEKELGHSEKANSFKKRGENLFDSIWSKEFQHIDETYTKMRGNGLYQGTRWQYRWGAPMFLNRMIARAGKQKLLKELNTFFDRELYNQGNEPDIHVPFLFGRLGDPRKTGLVVQQLARESITHRYGGNDAYPTPFVGCAFTDKPRGYAPEMDEDDGAMSAWYVYSCMGLYPVVVGEATYELFSPIFDHIRISLDEGKGEKHLTIATKNRTSMGQKVKKITWNGRTVKDFRIKHTSLKEGGELLFWY